MRPFFAALLTLVLTSLTLTTPGFAGPKSHKLSTKVTAKSSAPKSDKELAEEWVLGFMVKHAPPGRKTYYRDAQETKEEALKRYKSIAKDLVEVVYSPTNPVPFGGDYGRARTVSVMLGIMFYESGFGKNVDYGLGRYGRGDNGNSWCMMQILVGKSRVWARAGGWNVKHDRPWRWGDKKADLVTGASGPEMVADRRKCFTEGLRLIKLSFRSCSKRPLKEKLLMYASGECNPGIKAAMKASRLRMTAAIRYWNNTKAEWKRFKDDAVKSDLAAELAKRKKQKVLATHRKKRVEGKRAAVLPTNPQVKVATTHR